MASTATPKTLPAQRSPSAERPCLAPLDPTKLPRKPGACQRTGYRALAAFAKVFVADGSLMRLHPALQKHYPSVWTNHTKAGAKLHITIDSVSRTPEILRIVPGSKHDVTLLGVGRWCKGALLVFDLACYQGKLFRQIVDHGEYFLCRAKRDANFVIVSADDPRWLGRKHKEILSKATARSFEVEIDYAYRHIPERDWAYRHLRLRLIAVWRPDLNQHRFYVTNTTSRQLPPQTAAAVCALRWEIELLFRALKSQLRIDDMPSGNKAATELPTICRAAHASNRTQASLRTPNAPSFAE